MRSVLLNDYGGRGSKIYGLPFTTFSAGMKRSFLEVDDFVFSGQTRIRSHGITVYRFARGHRVLTCKLQYYSCQYMIKNYILVICQFGHIRWYGGCEQMSCLEIKIFKYHKFVIYELLNGIAFVTQSFWLITEHHAIQDSRFAYKKSSNDRGQQYLNLITIRI